MTSCCTKFVAHALAGMTRLLAGFRRHHSALSPVDSRAPLVLELEVRHRRKAALVDARGGGAARSGARRMRARRSSRQTTARRVGARLDRRSGILSLMLGQPLCRWVLLGPKCAFRIEAIRQLDDAGIPWRVAATSARPGGALGLSHWLDWASPFRKVSACRRNRVTGATMFDLPRLNRFAVRFMRDQCERMNA